MRQRFLLLVICLAAALAFAAPVAANNVPTTGIRISLFAAPATFPSATAFYVEHGSACDATEGDSASDCMQADTSFALYLDGALQSSTVDVENSPGGWVRFNLTNYPAGLAAGRHTLVGVWFRDGSAYQSLSARINFTR